MPRRGLPREGPVGGAFVVALEDPVSPAEIQWLCARVRGAAGAEVVVCDVGRIRRPSLATVDALARLRLSARRGGRDLRLGRPKADLRQLLVQVGLGDLFRTWPDLALEAGPKPEQREPPGGVEEEGDAADPVS